MKPTIYFKGARYRAGEAEGWRPQLEAAEKVADLALAEEIVLETRMAMSPDELLHAVKTALVTAPQLVAGDGRVREFAKLLRFNRTASGKIEGESGEWNETCHARVRAQLLKDGKTEIDANFVNSVESIAPKISNVTYNGAIGVMNALKPEYDFTAYGHNMVMLNGDSAKLVVGVSEFELSWTETDMAHTTYVWPTNVEPEPGTKVVFRMNSSAGVEGGERYDVLRRDIVVIGGDVPLPPHIDQTADGRVRVETITQDGQSAAFAPDKEWLLTGKGLSIYTTKQGAFKITSVVVDLDARTKGLPCTVVESESAQMKVKLAGSATHLPGAYPNAQVRLTATITNRPTASETLYVPINLVVP